MFFKGTKIYEAITKSISDRIFQEILEWIFEANRVKFSLNEFFVKFLDESMDEFPEWNFRTIGRFFGKIHDGIHNGNFGNGNFMYLGGQVSNTIKKS